MAEDAVVACKPIGRFRRAVWSALYGGMLGGLITAQTTALIFAGNSFGVHPWLFGLLVLLCAGAMVWIAHARLSRWLRPFALAETLGGYAGMWIALLLLTPPVNPFAQSEPFVLDFLFLATLAGLAIGAAIGAVSGIVIGLQSDELVDALLPWLWLLGGVIAVAGTIGLLLGERFDNWVMLAPTFIPGGVLAGWIAQREYLRLRDVHKAISTIEVKE